MAAIDVLGMGCVAVDELLYVSAFPSADSKMPIRRMDRQCGGLAFTALLAAARLGARCAYAGTLGMDDDSRLAIEHFQREGIDLTYLRRRPEVRPIRAWVIVEESSPSRTILYDLEGAVGAEPDWPPEEAIRTAKVLLIDHFGIEGMCRAARLARSAGVPVVADLEEKDWPGFEELLALVDHLIINRDFARRLTGEEKASAAVGRHGVAGRQTVVVTDGASGCWFRAAGPDGTVHHQPAFAFQATDTTGCGDVFHGAYAAALVWGWDAPARVRFASAAAALKASRPNSIPLRTEVESFLDQARS